MGKIFWKFFEKCFFGIFFLGNFVSDFFYNFSSKIDNDDETLKLNLDELYTKKQEQDLNVMNNYNKILVRIHNKIKYILLYRRKDNYMLVYYTIFN